jgi:excisionase family DNA binding protein
MTDGARPGLNTIPETATQLKLHPKTVEKLIHDNLLGHVRFGRRVLIHDDQIQVFIDKRRFNADGEEDES